MTLAAALLLALPAVAEEVRVEDLRPTDRVRVELRAGGAVEGAASALGDGTLVLRQGSERVEVPLALVARVELLARGEATGPLPRLATAAVVRPRLGRAVGAAVFGFVLPGPGVLAVGRRADGVAFFVTDLALLGAGIGTLAVNRDMLVGGILLGLDVSVRVAAAVVAFRAARAPRVAFGVVPTPGGVYAGLVFGGGGAPAGPPPRAASLTFEDPPF